MEKSKSDNTKFTLKACRVNKRLTLKEAADRLGISEFTLGNYESGKRSQQYQLLRELNGFMELVIIKLFFYHDITV